MCYLETSAKMLAVALLSEVQISIWSVFSFGRILSRINLGKKLMEKIISRL